MATLSLRLPTNVEGDFYVDETCIDCDACRQIAPRSFREEAGRSAVFSQPRDAAAMLDAQKALISCPTASIGMTTRRGMTEALAAYPEPIAENVYRCGFNSEHSFGAFSYLIRRDDGNILIDSPRFAGPLVKRIAAMGGVARMLLTHRDDVADHEKFHRRFGCERLMHAGDVGAETTSFELQPDGTSPRSIAEDMVMIPTPGHTRGHAVFLYRERFLFTGDHLAWDESGDRLYAFRSACWYSWTEQIASMEALLDHSFEWVLPGHGRPMHLSRARMHSELERCVDWMKRVR
ncbi:MAG TPA: MBL fold metallo-hydrolase [Thermoanaerobaculia bacterium]|nr:MBL fold metallo-hydrolase [Thermoanaerobaculia bacterium]